MDINKRQSPAALAPAITGVADSTGAAIANPGATSDTSLTLSGTGTPSGVMIILDNGAIIGSASANLMVPGRYPGPPF